MDTYLVGGAVRDELLGRSVADRDWVVVGATPEELLDKGFQQIGNEFPCFLHPDTKEEYALARTERKSGSGHTGFICDFHPEISLEEDLSRRDLTINAIAKSKCGEYVDPYGGRQDLSNKVLRHVSGAFVEDPLRVLRVARFAARYADLGFVVHEDTYSLMRRLVVNGELAELTPERVWKEMSRALSEPKPSEFFYVLRRCGALAVLLPELDKLFGVPQTEKYHPEVDTGRHVMLAIDLAKKVFDKDMVTWAVLLHDLGKGLTPEEEWPKHLLHEHKGVPLVKDVCERFKVPKDYKALALLVCEHHLRCHRLEETGANKVMKLLEVLDAIRRPERVRLFAEACEADARGRLGFEENIYPPGELLLACAAAAKKMDIKPLLNEGFEGVVLADKIRQRRIGAIKRVVSEFKKRQAGSVL